MVDHAFKRVAAAYSTVPDELSAVHSSTWAYIAVFAALVLPMGSRSGFLHLKVEKRPAKWLEVGPELVWAPSSTPENGGSCSVGLARQTPRLLAHVVMYVLRLPELLCSVLLH